MIIIRTPDTLVRFADGEDLFIKTECLCFSVEKGRRVFNNEGDYSLGCMIIETRDNQYKYILEDNFADDMTDYVINKIVCTNNDSDIVIDLGEWLRENNYSREDIRVERCKR